MTSWDFPRIAAFVAASFTYALAVANLVVSYKVLRPRPLTWQNFTGTGGGFIWLHILCVVIPFQGFVTWGLVEVHQRIGDQDLTWRSWLLGGLSAMISVGYVVIFRVELARLRLQRAVTEAKL